jgi:hypothetical protein
VDNDSDAPGTFVKDSLNAIMPRIKTIDMDLTTTITFSNYESIIYLDVDPMGFVTVTAISDGQLDGHRLILNILSDGIIVLPNALGNVQLCGNWSPAGTGSSILLEWDGSNWIEILRFSGTTNDAGGTGSFVTGASNSAPDSVLSVVGGISNVLSGSDATVVIGVDLSVTDADSSAVFGESHVLTSSDYSIVAGYDNLVDCQLSAIFGTSHVVDGDGIIVSGNEHIIYGNYNSVFGYQHDVDGIRNLVGGHLHFIEGDDNLLACNSNTVVGDDNCLVGNDISVIGNCNLCSGITFDLTGNYNIAAGYQHILSTTSINYCAVFGIECESDVDSTLVYGDGAWGRIKGMFAFSPLQGIGGGKSSVRGGIVTQRKVTNDASVLNMEPLITIPDDTTVLLKGIITVRQTSGVNQGSSGGWKFEVLVAKTSGSLYIYGGPTITPTQISLDANISGVVITIKDDGSGDLTIEVQGLVGTNLIWGAVTTICEVDDNGN